MFQTRSRNNSILSTSPALQHPFSLSAQGPSSQLPQQDYGNGGAMDQDASQQGPLQRRPSTRPATAARPQLFSDFFRRYELMIEFTNLRNPHHCPSGLYVMPAADDMHQWFGTLFIHKGYYRDAVFKFQLSIPQDYPDRRPTVRFNSDMWHPLIDNQGYLALQYQFPQWRPHRDYLFHVLHFIKAAFKKCVLDTILEKQAVNKEAYRMYRQENKIFARLAQQRAQLSITDSILYENYPANNSIRFSPLGEEEFDDLKQKMMSSATSNGIMALSLAGDKRSETFDSIMAGLAD